MSSTSTDGIGFSMDGTYGYPSATNSSAVTVQVAAIIDTDVG